jgi:hypothetical protein
MTTPMAGTAPDTVPPRTAAGDGGLPGARAWRPSFSRAEVAFLVAVPVLWAVLLAFHAAPDGSDIYGGLAGEGTRWIAVHLGSVFFIDLMAVALLLLLRGVPGTAAKVSRVALFPFVVLYTAGDAILGVATGVLVNHADDLPASERAGTADSIQALWDNFLTGDFLLGAGGTAWIVAAIAAAVALKKVGARTAVVVLVALSAIVALHPPPFGPFGLLCFAAAVGLLARGQRVRAREEAPA